MSWSHDRVHRQNLTHSNRKSGDYPFEFFYVCVFFNPFTAGAAYIRVLILC